MEFVMGNPDLIAVILRNIPLFWMVRVMRACKAWQNAILRDHLTYVAALAAAPLTRTVFSNVFGLTMVEAR